MDSKKLVEILSQKITSEKGETEKLLNHFVEIVTDSLKEGDTISIPTIGNFETKMRTERVAIHPSSGKKLLIPPKLSVVFKPSNLLKQKIR